jgi:hypothetical protein
MVQENRKMVSLRESTMMELEKIKTQTNLVSLDATLNLLLDYFINKKK